MCIHIYIYTYPSIYIYMYRIHPAKRPKGIFLSQSSLYSNLWPSVANLEDTPALACTWTTIFHISGGKIRGNFTATFPKAPRCWLRVESGETPEKWGRGFLPWQPRISWVSVKVHRVSSWKHVETHGFHHYRKSRFVHEKETIFLLFWRPHASSA